MFGVASRQGRYLHTAHTNLGLSRSHFRLIPQTAKAAVKDISPGAHSSLFNELNFSEPNRIALTQHGDEVSAG